MIRKSFVQHSPLRSKRANRKSSTYTRWTPEEDELLRQAVALHGPHKWSLIASHVPNRTPMQCSTRWLGALKYVWSYTHAMYLVDIYLFHSPNIHKGRWTEHEDAVLRYAYMEFAGIPDGEGGFQPIPWNRIAERIPNRTGIQCQARWTEALDPSVRKGKWSEAEDALLRAGVDKFGRCWIRIAETVPGRTQVFISIATWYHSNGDSCYRVFRDNVVLDGCRSNQRRINCRAKNHHAKDQHALHLWMMQLNYQAVHPPSQIHRLILPLPIHRYNISSNTTLFVF